MFKFSEKKKTLKKNLLQTLWPSVIAVFVDII